MSDDEPTRTIEMEFPEDQADRIEKAAVVKGTKLERFCENAVIARLNAVNVSLQQVHGVTLDEVELQEDQVGPFGP